MSQLIGYLTGQAKEIAEGFPINAASYPIVVDRLKTWFGDNNLIKKRLHKELTHLPRVKDSDLRPISVAVERICRQLEAQGEDVNHPQIQEAIESKLPAWFLNEVFTVAENDADWNATKLRAYLEKWVRVRIKTQEATDNVTYTSQKSNNLDRRSHFNNRQYDNNVSSTLISSDAKQTDNGKKPLRPCLLCSGMHWNDMCSAYVTQQSRKNRLRELKICSKCLKQGHSAMACPSEKERYCTHCKAKNNHYSFLCFKRPLPPQTAGNNTTQNTNKSYFSSKTQPANTNFVASGSNWTCGSEQQNKVNNSLTTPVYYGNNYSPLNFGQSASKQQSADKSKIDEAHTTLFVADQDLEQETSPEIVMNINGQSDIYTRGQEVLLLTKEVPIFNPSHPDKEIMALLVFDPASHGSFGRDKEMNDLYPIKPEPDAIRIGKFGTEKSESMQSHTLDLGIRNVDGSSQIIKIKTVKTITGKIKTIKANNDESLDFGAYKLKVPTEFKAPVVLVGADFLYNFIDYTTIRPIESGFWVIDSTVGTLVTGSGELCSWSSLRTPKLCCMTTFGEQEVDDFVLPKKSSLENFWNLELIGITDSPIKDDDIETMRAFQKTICRNDNRYMVRWPWKHPNPDLPDNFALSFGRLKSVTRRLSDNKELMGKYHDIFQEQLKKGIIEPVNLEDPPLSKIIHYLAHQHVITPSKTTTKLRIVFDASSKIKKDYLSLNDCLYRGPVLLPDLCGILMRFRIPPIVVVADVEKAFLQIDLFPPDKEVTRFLWLKDINQPASSENLQIYRYKRVNFGVVSSPFLLAATIRYHFQQSKSPLAKVIERNTYADNLILAAENTNEAITNCKIAKEGFQDACMNIREFLSNDPETNQSIPEEDKQPYKAAKVLGILWDPKKDDLEFDLPIPILGEKVTKRIILSLVAKIYDPLGLLCPLVLPMKVFIQQTWREKFEWDDQLDEKSVQKWYTIIKNWDDGKISLPRRVAPANIIEAQLHVFTDASILAYAAVGYLVFQGYEPWIIYSKNRLCPTQGMTIPRMELMGVLIGTRILKFIEEETDLKIQDEFLWTDSQCVLGWINSQKIQSNFVENRLKEIRKTKAQIRYVPTKENPADISTRGMDIMSLKTNKLWWNGPIWLSEEAGKWPTWNTSYIQEVEDIEKEKDEEKVALIAAPSILPTVTEPLIDATKFSSWTKLIRTVAFILRFINMAVFSTLQNKNEFVGKLSKITTKGKISVSDLNIAKIVVLRQCQNEGREEYPEQFQKEVIKNELWTDSDGLLRCGGRLARADLPVKTKHPIYLPKNNKLTNLIIQHIHEQDCHSGLNYTLAKVRDEYWVSKGRSKVKSILKDCYGCKRWTAKPFALPVMPSLPAERVSRQVPFQYCGLDYLGPTLVKISAEYEKVWVALFTCFPTRAVHLEVVTDISAKGFLNALRRFVARRGRPKVIHSDNGTCFKLGAKLLDTADFVNDPETINYCQNHTQMIEFRFIPEYSPWSGGLWERMVGVFKTSYRKAVGKRKLTYEEFSTLTTEIEAIVNGRPLTYLYEESLEVIRPVDFLIPKADLNIPLVIDHDKDLEYVPKIESREALLRYFQKSTEILDKFWLYWYNEYLKSLRERNDKHHHSKSELFRPPNIGEIGLIYEENCVRSMWKLGKIIHLHKGNDQEIRSVTVRTAVGRDLKRPVSHFFPLEIDQSEPIGEELTADNGKEVDALRRNVVGQGEAAAVERPTAAHGRPIRVKRRPAKYQNTIIPTCLAAVDIPRSPNKYRNKPTPRKLYFSVAMVTLIICLVQTWLIISAEASASGEAPPYKGKIHTQCSQTDHLQHVHSQYCMSIGMAVYQQKNGNLCWSQLHCPSGHIVKKPSATKFCGPKCGCDSWANGCSFYTGPSTKQSKIKIESVAKILKENYPDICSLGKSEKCMLNPQARHFKQIELFDSTKHLVENLQIVHRQELNEEFLCVGEGRVTGSPRYCEQHQCEDSGTKFCYYGHNEMAFFTSEHGEILIKAWGEVVLWVYDHLPQSQVTACEMCQIQCIQGGVKLTLPEGIGAVEVCSEPFCYQTNQPSSMHEVHFPAEILLQDHHIRVKIFARGFLVKHLGIECPSKPYCEMITWYVCWARILNLGCTPKFVLTILSIVAYLGSMGVYIIYFIAKNVIVNGLTIFQAIIKLLRNIWRALKWCIRLVVELIFMLYQKIKPKIGKRLTRRQKKPQQENDTQPSLQRAYKAEYRANSLLHLALLSVILVQIQACSELSAIVGKAEECKSSPQGTECEYNEVALLNVLPRGQASCLLLKDQNDKPIGNIQFSLRYVLLECQARTITFTRSFRMHTQFSKRCASAGSCHGDVCASIKPDSAIDELDLVANSAPGYSKCVNSCGGFGCGCFYPTYGCLFFRYYAEPVDQDVIEIFDCPTWETKVALDIKIQVGNDSHDHSFKLSPERKFSFQRVKISLASITPPQMPILAGQFLTNGRQTLMLEPSETLTHFKCSTKEKAKTFNCSVPSQICDCWHADPRINCDCEQQDYRRRFEKADKILPIASQALFLQTAEGRVNAHVTGNTALQLHVELDNLKMALKIDNSVCRIREAELKGCFNCATGAVFKFKCSTQFGRALAVINCDEVSTTALCDSKVSVQHLHLHFHHSMVEENCTVICPGGSTEFLLKGELSFVELEFSQGQISNAHQKLHPQDGFNPTEIWDWIQSEWNRIIIVTVATVAGMATIYLTGPYLVTQICCKLTRRK